MLLFYPCLGLEICISLHFLSKIMYRNSKGKGETAEFMVQDAR
jgi:hypothetical protein